MLVRNTSNRICGIVTTSDLSVQFQHLAEPFLLLGEIENHLRRLIDGRFSLSDLRSVRDPADNARPIESVADLSFGEYARLLQDPARWGRIQIPIDRQVFLRDIDAVRAIRNDVMHFDPDPIDPEDLARLRRVVQFLRQVAQLSR